MIFTDLAKRLTKRRMTITHKDNVVVLTSKERLDKRIIADDNHHLVRKRGHKYPTRVVKFQFARVLVDEDHDIRGVNTTFLNETSY